MKKTIRTKVIATVLSAVTLLSVSTAAVSSVSASWNAEVPEYIEQSETDIAGAFTPAESPIVTDDIKNLVKKATANIYGAEYEPVSYIASQVVAGTNHLILCKITPVVPNAVGHYALVTIYESFNGDAEILKIQDSEKEVPPTAEDGIALAGGYSDRENPEITDEDKTVMNKAVECLCGADYEPVAHIAS